MKEAKHSVDRHETHEEFVQRVGRVFPEDRVRAWSRIERGVFNQLMSQLIHKHSYGSISNEMLYQCHEKLLKTVQNFRESEL
ncbi:MAG: hypothetical protein IV101_12880 [Dechloromonas sp.]|uniref:hypothetical protein n=1 Tax=Dechloromonas sp. TaxID=1917218 RepID=UPI0027F73D0E|nr:hypothetical protein [Dechloromonas sp.]MBT9521775.1 hypothetical protein [Dechloromonas sp.]